MLRALLLADSALDTTGGVPACRFREKVAPPGIVEVVEHAAGIVSEKHSGDIHAALAGHTVLAPGAGNRDFRLISRFGFFEEIEFLLREAVGDKIRFGKKFDVFLQLLQGGHAA